MSIVLSGIRSMVVTDDKRIVSECLDHSIPVDIITEKCNTGTDRLQDCEREQNVSWIINVQGDEPLKSK